MVDFYLGLESVPTLDSSFFRRYLSARVAGKEEDGSRAVCVSLCAEG